jgi:hypothetical protein
MLFGIWLIILGALAVPNLILKKPELKSALDKITPYQGWIGIVSALWGVWGLVNSVLHLSWLTAAPIWWLTLTANNALLLALGILLGVGTAKTFVKDDAAKARMDQTAAKIAPYQGTLGLIALGLGAWCVVASILFHL